MWSKRIVIGWFVWSLINNFYEIFEWQKTKETTPWALYIPHIFNYPYEINTFVDLLFISILWFVQYF